MAAAKKQRHKKEKAVLFSAPLTVQQRMTAHKNANTNPKPGSMKKRENMHRSMTEARFSSVFITFLKPFLSIHSIIHLHPIIDEKEKKGKGNSADHDICHP